MPYCSGCGTENRVTSKFCPECGEAAASSAVGNPGYAAPQRRSELHCPTCHSEDVRRLSLVHKEGFSLQNTQSRGAGVGIGAGGVGFGIGRSTTSGTNQTALSDMTAPPKLDLRLPFYLAVIGAFVLASGNALLVLLGIGALGFAGYMLYRMWVNHQEHAGLWKRSFFCLRCGRMFLPSTSPSPSPDQNTAQTPPPAPISRQVFTGSDRTLVAWGGGGIAVIMLMAVCSHQGTSTTASTAYSEPPIAAEELSMTLDRPEGLVAVESPATEVVRSDIAPEPTPQRSASRSDGYQRTFANVWPGKKLYLASDLTYVGEVIDVADKQRFPDGTIRKAVLISFADGEVDWIPRDVVTRIYLTK